MKSLTEQDVKDALYVTSPVGVGELRGFLHRRWGQYDEKSLALTMDRLIQQGIVSEMSVNGVHMWCLRGQRIG